MNKKIKIVIGVLAIVGIIGLIVLAIYGIMKGFSFFATLVPVYISGSLIVLGILSIIAGKLFLRKKNVYKKIAPKHIVLETPLYADYTYVAGVFLLCMGLITFGPVFSYLKDDSFILGFMIFFILITMVIMVFRLLYGLHDKIEVTSNFIRYDDPNEKSTLTIEQSQIIEILHLKVFSLSHYGYSENAYNFELFIKYTNSKDEEVTLALKPEDMNLKLELLVESIAECSYPIVMRSKKILEGIEWEGHHFKED
jgi:hypothetical protein